MLILSNLTAAKIIKIGNIEATAAVFFFPITYVIGDIFTEVYGFNSARRMIWLGLLVNFTIIIGTYLVLIMPSSSNWHQQKAFESVFTMSSRILIASTLAYLVGEFINSIFLAKMKIIFKGKYFWLRALGGSILAAGLDTIIFMYVAFWQNINNEIIVSMIINEYTFKIVCEVLLLPLTFYLANKLKKADRIDHYDYGTIFNPFAL